MTDIAAIAFDKDGTLSDFRATWGAWTGRFIRDIAAPWDRVDRLAEGVRFDLDAERHLPDSPFIAGTVEDWMEVVLEVIPELPRAALKERILSQSADVVQVPATPLEPLLSGLRAAGYPLGLVTNDGEAPARRHLERMGIAAHFDFVAGFDSGHGGKPAPGMLLACAAALGLPPQRVLMVGDSLHDLHAARAAGMPAVAVLTGYATAEVLAPHAEAVLDHVGLLPEWLETRKATRNMSQTAMPG